MFRNFVADYGGITRKQAKKTIIKILHFGLPDSELPLLWALAAEFRMAAQVVLDKPKFAYLAGKFGDRRSPLTSGLYYALSSVEDAITRELAESLEREFTEHARVIVLMFDGLVVQMQGVDPDAVRRVLADVGGRWKVTFSIDKF